MISLRRLKSCSHERLYHRGTRKDYSNEARVVRFSSLEEHETGDLPGLRLSLSPRWGEVDLLHLLFRAPILLKGCR